MGQEEKTASNNKYVYVRICKDDLYKVIRSIEQMKQVDYVCSRIGLVLHVVEFFVAVFISFTLAFVLLNINWILMSLLKSFILNKGLIIIKILTSTEQNNV